jgi:hypothetical protein
MGPCTRVRVSNWNDYWSFAAIGMPPREAIYEAPCHLRPNRAILEDADLKVIQAMTRRLKLTFWDLGRYREIAQSLVIRERRRIGLVICRPDDLRDLHHLARDIALRAIIIASLSG